MKHIKTIIFDMGGVLLDLNTDKCLAAFAKIGFPQFSKYLDPYVQHGFFLDFERGKITSEEFCEEIRRLSGKEISNIDIIHALEQFADGIPAYKLSTLLALRRQYQVFMLSNCNDITISHLMKNDFRQQGLSIDDYFDRLFLSYKMGCTKPGKMIFEKLIEESNINPQETLFLDDGEQNILTGNELGFQTYLVKPKEDFRHLFFGPQTTLE